MTRTVIKSLLVGLGAAVLCLVLGFVADTFIVPKFLHRTDAPVAKSMPPASQNTDNFTVTTYDVETISETSWDDPYIGPISVAVLIVVSSWMLIRLRRSASASSGNETR